jgi:hypothetical protein
MAAPLNTCTTIEQRGFVRFLWAENMEAAKDILCGFFVEYATHSTLKPVPTLPRQRQITVTVLLQIPDAVDTVLYAPDDG